MPHSNKLIPLPRISREGDKRRVCRGFVVKRSENRGESRKIKSDDVGTRGIT